MERVGIYNRCSTEEESQMNALAAQAFESRELAEKNGWRIVEQYIESQTGTVAYKRSEYQRMLEDMEKDRFDIIMIKSIDRLTRSAKDWYFFISRLTENKLKLYIYIEGKFYTPDDNLISGIKAILAEDFSRELSKKIKNAHRQRQQKKSGCNITCDMFGWNKAGQNQYEVNEEEAAYYRMAFALAKEGKGFYTISNTMYELGARGRRGRKISEVQWRKMLYTPRAHGTMILNTKTYNFDARKYEPVPEQDWIVMENALPPIVSREYQEEVIRIMKGRALQYQNGIGSPKAKRSGRYELTGKLKCGECGRFYYRTCYASGREKRVVWKCATFLESGRRGGNTCPCGCDNIHLSEEGIFLCVKDALKDYYEPLWGKEEILNDVMKLLEKELDAQNGRKELQRLEKEHRKLVAKKDILIEKLLKGVLEDRDFQRCSAELAARCRLLETKIGSIKQSQLQYNHYKTRLEEIRTVILKESLIEKAETMELLGQVYQIEVHRDGRLLISFEKEGGFWKEVVYEAGR